MGKKRKVNDIATKSRQCCCKCHEEEHRKRWQKYRSSQLSTDNSSQNPPLSERDIWVQGNLTSKSRVYSFGAEGVMMTQRSRLSVSSHSSSVNNYDAREMAMRLNESAVKAAEEARQAEEARKKEWQEFRKQFEEEMRAKEAKFQNKLTQEKAARQRDKEKVKSKISKLWKFFKSQQVGSSTAPPDATPSEDDSSHD